MGGSTRNDSCGVVVTKDEVSAMTLADLLEGRAVYVELGVPVVRGELLVVVSGGEAVGVVACAASEGVDLAGLRPTLVRVARGGEV